ncbi:MAG: ribosome silencing factor [Alphaproteobacteria bacterium]|nr:ribosome silencing factor [Alphaproteobacteria bacterium]
MTETNNELLELIETTLDNNKAEDIVTIDLKGKTSIANYMVIASGTSNRHVASLADKLKYELKQKGYSATSEGEEKANWVLIDAFDVIVHIFCPEVRDFYNLEKMWNSVAELRKN